MKFKYILYPILIILILIAIFIKWNSKPMKIYAAEPQKSLYREPVGKTYLIRAYIDKKNISHINPNTRIDYIDGILYVHRTNILLPENTKDIIPEIFYSEKQIVVSEKIVSDRNSNKILYDYSYRIFNIPWGKYTFQIINDFSDSFEKKITLNENNSSI